MHLGFFTVVLCLLHCFNVALVYSQPSVIPGYLDFDNLPDTNFSCQKKVIGGYYADIETGCQMFHVCTIGQKGEVTDIKFLCLNGTVFDQETRVCERVDEVDCSQAEEFFDLNLELYGSNIPFGFPSEDEDTPEESSGTEHESKKEDSTTHASTTTTSTTTSTTTTTTTTTTTPRPTFPSTTHKPSTSLPSLHYLSITTHRPPTYNIRPPQQQHHHQHHPYHQQNGGSTQRNPNNQNYQTVSTTLPTISYNTSPRYPVSKPDPNKGSHTGHHNHFPLSPSPGASPLLTIRNNFDNANEEDDRDDHVQFEDDLEDYESSGNGDEFEEDEDEEEEEEEEIVIKRPGPHANRFPVTTIGNDNVRVENNGAVQKGQPVNGHSAFTESLAQRNRQSIPHGNQGYAYHRKNNPYADGYDSDNQNTDVHSQQHQLTTDYVLSRQKDNNNNAKHHSGGFNSNNQFSYSTSTPTSSHFYRQQNGAAFSSTIQPFLLPPLLKSETDASEYESQKIGRQVQQQPGGGGGGASLLKRKLEEEIHRAREGGGAHSHHAPVKTAPVNPLFTTPSVAIVSQTSSTSFVSSVSRVTHPTTPGNGTILGISTVVTSVGTTQHNPHNLSLDASAFRHAKHVETTPPGSYDEYLEGDVQKDPFYIDVPRIASKKRQRRDTPTQTSKVRTKHPSKSAITSPDGKRSRNDPEFPKPHQKKNIGPLNDPESPKPHQKKNHGSKYNKKKGVHGKKRSKPSKKSHKSGSSSKVRNARDTGSVRKHRQVVADVAATRSGVIQFQTGEHVSVSSSPSHYVSRGQPARKNPNLKSVVSFQDRQRALPSKSLITEAIFEPRRPSGDVTTPTPRQRTPQAARETQRTSAVRSNPPPIPVTVQPPVEHPQRSPPRGGISLEAFGPSVNRKTIKTPGRHRGVNTPASTFLADYPVEMVELRTKSHMVAMVPTHDKVSPEFLRTLEGTPAPLRNPNIPSHRRQGHQQPPSSTLASHRQYDTIYRSAPPSTTPLPANQNAPTHLATEPSIPSPVTLPTGDDRRIKTEGSTSRPEIQPETHDTASILDVPPVTNPTKSPRGSRRQRVRESSSEPPRTSSRNARRGPVTFDGQASSDTFHSRRTPNVAAPESPEVSPRSTKDAPLSEQTTPGGPVRRRPANRGSYRASVSSEPPPQSRRVPQSRASTSTAGVPAATQSASDSPVSTEVSTQAPLPVTSFTCADKLPGGYYADLEADCQLFHICSQGRHGRITDNKFLCGPGTRFNQQSRTCQSRDLVDCELSASLYHLNNHFTPPAAEVEVLPSEPKFEARKLRRGRTKRSTIEAIDAANDTDDRAKRQTEIPFYEEDYDFEDLSYEAGDDPVTTNEAKNEATPLKNEVKASKNEATPLKNEAKSPAKVAKQLDGYDDYFFVDYADPKKAKNDANIRTLEPSAVTTPSTPSIDDSLKATTALDADYYLSNDYVNDNYEPVAYNVTPHETEDDTQLESTKNATSLVVDFETAPQSDESPGSPVDKTQTVIPPPKVIPSVTKPPKPIPSVTKPPKLLPSVTEPPKLIPSVTKPPKLIPSVTKPPKSIPSVTKPPKVIPSVTKPPKLIPSVTEAPKLIPFVTKPPKLIPSVTKPPKDIPSVTKPPKLIPSVTKPPKVIPSVTSPPKLIPSGTKPPKVNPSVIPPPKLIPSVTKPPKVIPPVSKPPKVVPSVTPPPKEKPEYYEDYYYYDDEPLPNVKQSAEGESKAAKVETDRIEEGKEEEEPLTTVHSADRRDEIADSEVTEEGEREATGGEEREETDRPDVSRIYFTTVVPDETELLSTPGPLDAIRDVVLRLLDDDRMFEEGSTLGDPETTESFVETTPMPTTVMMPTTTEPSTTTTTTPEPTTTMTTTTTTTPEPTTTTTTTTTPEPTTTSTTTTTTPKPKRKSNRPRPLTTTAHPPTIRGLFERTRSRPTPRYNNGEFELPAVRIKSATAMTTRRPPYLTSRNHFNKIRQQNNIVDDSDHRKEEDSETAKSDLSATTVFKPESTTYDYEEDVSTSPPLVAITITNLDEGPKPSLESSTPLTTPEEPSKPPVAITKTSPIKDPASVTKPSIDSPPTPGEPSKPPAEVQSEARDDEPSRRLLESFARMSDETFYPEARGFGENLNDKTRFSCLHREMYRYYPDVDDARTFHYCSPGFHGRQKLDFLFVCDLRTTFNAQLQRCE